MRDRRERGPEERGTALVEYALVLAMLALPAVAATDYLGSNAKTLFETASAGIESSPLVVNGTTSTTTPSGTTTTTAPTTTTTTAPTTTTSSPATSTTTTTTAPTTTTTTSTTTTTTAPPQANAALRDATTQTHGSNNWSASTRVTVTGPDGERIQGAQVTVTIRYLYDNRWTQEFWEEETVVVTTNSNGRKNINSDRVRRRGHTVVREIEFVVTDVTAAGYEWDEFPTKVSAEL